MVGTIEGNELVLAINSTVNYLRIGARYINEPNFVAHFVASSNPDEVIPEISATEASISSVVSGALGLYRVHGTVVGVNAQSFLINDGTGMILVYQGSSWTPDVAVGDKVTVTGATTTYGNAKQFGQSATYEKIGTEAVTQPTPKELSASELDAFATNLAITPVYVKLKGVFNVSGYYYNVAFNGATIVGSVTYPIDDLSSLNGKTVEIVGYITGVSGNGSFLNIMYTSITEVEGSTDEPGGDDTPSLPTAVTPIGTILAGELGNYMAEGTVILVNAQSFLISDGTGMMLVYKGASWTPDVAVGDKVKVVGQTTVYGLATQFGTGATYEKIGTGEVTYPTPSELTATELDAYATKETVTPVYVKVEGSFSISGSYYNLAFDGATIVGSVTYPIDDLSSLNGKTVEVVGYITGVSGNGSFLNIMYTSITELEGSTETPEDPDPNPGEGGEEGGETPEVTTATTIPEVLAAEDGTAAVVSGTIYEVHTPWNGTNTSVYIKDADGNTLYVYRLATEVALGDVITVTGTVGSYNGKQIAAGATAVVTGHDDKIKIDYTEMTITEALAAEDGTFVKVTGTVSEILTAWNASYGNMCVNITDSEGNTIYVYRLYTEVAEGDTIVISGKIATHNSQKQIGEGCTAVKVEAGETPEDPNPEVPEDPNPETPATATAIGTIITSENGAFVAEGVVVGVNKQSFLISDGTGIILVYKGSGWTPDVVVGDKVKVSGDTTVYGNAKQFGQTATYEKVGTENVTQPTPVELTAAELDAYKTNTAITPVYVKVKGVLTVSGYYLNVAFDGATIIGSITYPIDDFTALNGKTIEIVGYVTGAPSSGTYLNLMYTSVTEVQGSTETPEDPNPGETPEVTTATTIPEVLAAEDGTAAVVSGTIYEVHTPWNGTNTSVYIKDADGNTLYVYRLATEVALGDVITVTGTVGSYNGKQIAAGATAVVTGHDDTIKIDYTEMTITEALAAEDGTFVKVTGTVSEIKTAWSASYGNMCVNITDSEGNTIYVYRLYTEVVKGDTIVISGKMDTYNNKRQIGEGCTAVKVEAGETPEDPNPNPGEGETDVPEAPVVGTAYTLGLYQAQNGEKLYFIGTTENATVTYRLAMSNDRADAVKVYLEAVDGVEGGYRLYFYDSSNGNAKTYIRVYERDAGKGSGSLELVTTAPTEYLTYNAELGILVYTSGANSYYLGTYGTYATISTSNTSYITGSNAVNVGVTQYPAVLDVYESN